jgi:hypothetical protein
MANLLPASLAAGSAAGMRSSSALTAIPGQDTRSTERQSIFFNLSDKIRYSMSRA